MELSKVETCMDKIKNAVEYTVKSLVDKPEKVSVSMNDTGQVTVFELTVDAKDRGKVIGREGKNANALRTLINAAATREGKRVLLEILED
jgi:predicted RNA-binding protein YlqC (UPF0109 family)